ncbi:RES domain-containing protein [Mesorhizobium sp. M0815]|uniref:RES domain-containing protein n=1 Tax=Mesorhizobium sp. M0815 TaxID=2957005 RepID=UPI00333C1C65
MGSAWATALGNGERPASWSIYDRLRPEGIAGILVPSFGPGAETEDRNLVLWDWRSSAQSERVRSERSAAERPAVLAMKQARRLRGCPNGRKPVS